MTFSEALIELKKGKHITRDGWNGKSQYLALAVSVLWEEHNGEKYQLSHYTAGNQSIVFHGTSGCQVGWLASQADMLSDDWRVMNEHS